MNKKSLKIRFIISIVLLIIIVGGWLFLGTNNYYSNKNLILKRFFDNQNEILTKNIENLNLGNDYNLNINYKKNEETKMLGLYANLKDNELKVYNENNYYDINEYLKKYYFNIDSKNILNKNNYKTIYTSIINSVLNNKDSLNIVINKDKKNKKYIYNYTFNDLIVITSTLKTDTNFIKAMKDTFNMSDKNVINFLDSIKLKRVELSIITKGFKREIISYTFRIDGLLSISNTDNIYSGYINNIGFLIDTSKNEIVINTEEEEIEILNVTEANSKFDTRNYQKMTTLDIFSLLNFK